MRRPRAHRALGRGACLMIAALATLAACAAANAPPDPPDPAPGAGATRHVGPTDRSCAGITVAPTDDVQAAVDAHPEGSTFCLSAGTYRLAAPLVPKRGDAFVGQRGAVLSGAKVLGGWRAAGSAWTAPGFLPDTPLTSDYCLESAPLCTRPEDVFLDGRPLRPVASTDAVTAGTFYADYPANTITIGDDPGPHLVEQAVAPSLVRATVDAVTITNLVLEHAANRRRSDDNRAEYALVASERNDSECASAALPIVREKERHIAGQTARILDDQWKTRAADLRDE